MNPTRVNPHEDEQHFDLPFFYVYDADELTDGQSYQLQSVQLTNSSDFILRRIAGRNLVAGGVRYYDELAQARSSAPFKMLPDYVVAPELRYSPDAMIRLDLDTVAKAKWNYAAGGSTPNYYSQMVFQGVRRFYGVNSWGSQYTYYEKPRVYRQDITVDWTGRIAPAYTQLAPAKTFFLSIDDRDFELQSMAILIQKNGVASPVPSYAAVKITLYDAAQQALSTAPVVDFFYSINTAYYNSCFPVPTLLYPAGSIIRVDVQSLLIESEVSATLSIIYNGVSRFPSC